VTPKTSRQIREIDVAEVIAEMGPLLGRDAGCLG